MILLDFSSDYKKWRKLSTFRTNQLWGTHHSQTGMFYLYFIFLLGDSMTHIYSQTCVQVWSAFSCAWLDITQPVLLISLQTMYNSKCFSFFSFLLTAINKIYLWFLFILLIEMWYKIIYFKDIRSARRD